jgi:hypothetical protein
MRGYPWQCKPGMARAWGLGCATRAPRVPPHAPGWGHGVSFGGGTGAYTTGGHGGAGGFGQLKRAMRYAMPGPRGRGNAHSKPWHVRGGRGVATHATGLAGSACATTFVGWPRGCPLYVRIRVWWACGARGARPRFGGALGSLVVPCVYPLRGCYSGMGNIPHAGVGVV